MGYASPRLFLNKSYLFIKEYILFMIFFSKSSCVLKKKEVKNANNNLLYLVRLRACDVTS